MGRGTRWIMRSTVLCFHEIHCLLTLDSANLSAPDPEGSNIRAGTCRGARGRAMTAP
jgi:hypothetical protein